MGLFFVGLVFCLFKDLIFGFSFLIRRIHILTTVLITLNSRCIFSFIMIVQLNCITCNLD